MTVLNYTRSGIDRILKKMPIDDVCAWTGLAREIWDTDVVIHGPCPMNIYMFFADNAKSITVRRGP